VEAFITLSLCKGQVKLRVGYDEGEGKGEGEGAKTRVSVWVG
jgi:hypothetical protein